MGNVQSQSSGSNGLESTKDSTKPLPVLIGQKRKARNSPGKKLGAKGVVVKVKLEEEVDVKPRSPKKKKNPLTKMTKDDECMVKLIGQNNPTNKPRYA